MKKIILICICSLSITALADDFYNNLGPDFNTNGYIDVSYNYLVRNNKFSSGTYNRTYDITPNGPSLQQASATLSYEPEEGFGALINPVIGRDPNVFAPYGWDRDFTDNRIGFALLQAYLQYKAEDYSIIAGQMINSANHDSPVPTQTRHFSRSILWSFSTPTTNFGVQGSYNLNRQVTLGAGVNNGWDSIRDFSRPKTFMFSIGYTPNDLLDLSVNIFRGGQRATDKTSKGPIGTRTLIDLVAAVTINDKLKFVANYDYDTQNKANLPSNRLGKAVWHGIAGYLDYTVNNKWWLALRGEIFSDRNGFATGVKQTIKETTFTVGYLPTKYFELRAETRHDHANSNTFVTANGKNFSNTQHSYALEGIYKY